MKAISYTIIFALFNLIFINGIQAQAKTQAEKLMDALIAKDLNVSMVLVKKVDDVNYCDEKSNSLLDIAAYYGYLEVCKILLNKGANVNLQKNNGVTALILASTVGHTEVVKLLLDNGAKIDLQSDGGVTALLIASEEGNTEVVKLLLEQGAKLDFQQPNDRATPLIYASRNGHIDIVKLLLEKGAKVDLQTNQGVTALMMACYNGYQLVVKTLLENGANTDVKNIGGYTAYDYAKNDFIRTLLKTYKSFSEKNLVYVDGKIDFIESYLNLSFLVDSTIDKAAYYKEIDIICNEVEKEIEGYESPTELIEIINNYLFENEGFRYNPDGNKFYSGTDYEKQEVIEKGVDQKDFMIMPYAIENREGICSSLSMLYLTIAYKLRLPMFGVVAPGHMFVRFNDNKIKINIEPTNGGREFSDDYYREKFIKESKCDFFLQDLNYEQIIGIYLEAIGSILNRDNKFEKSIECYDLAIKINPEFYNSYNARGAVMAKLKDYEGAIEDYTAAIKIYPEFAEAYNNRGAAKFELQEYEGAIDDYDTAIKIKPRYAAYYNRGYAKFELLDPKGAIDDFNTSIMINPKRFEAYLGRGNAKIDLEDGKGAIEDYNMAIKINPNHAEAYFKRGLAKLILRQDDSACLDLKKADELGFTDALELIRKYCQ